MSGRAGYWALVAVTVAVYLAMVLWSLPFIAAEAGGLLPFDLRPRGYSHDEARAFLAALSEAGRARYGGAQAMLDAIYPSLLFVTLSIALWHLSEGLRRPTRIGLIVVAALGMGFDMFENMAVRDMLIAGPEGVTPEMVSRASFNTVVKSAAHSVSFLALAVLLVRHAIRRRWAG